MRGITPTCLAQKIPLGDDDESGLDKSKYCPQSSRRMKGNNKVPMSTDRIAAVLTIVSLLIAVCVLWQRVALLNGTIASLDEKLNYHTLSTMSAPAIEKKVETAIVNNNNAALVVPKKTMGELGGPGGTEIGRASCRERVSDPV